MDSQLIILIVGVVFMGGLMFWSQWQSRRRRQKQIEELRVGARVATIGGIIGKLTYLDSEEGRARIEVAPGVEIEVLLRAIGRTLTPSE